MNLDVWMEEVLADAPLTYTLLILKSKSFLRARIPRVLTAPETRAEATRTTFTLFIIL